MKQLRKIIFSLGWGFLIPVLLLIFWQIAGDQEIINSSIMPKPSILGQRFSELLQDGTLWDNLRISLLRVLSGYLLGAALGLFLGIIIGFSKTAQKLSSVMIGLFRPIPALACIPILILLLGIGEESKIVVIMIGSFWPMLLNTIQGIHNVDPKLLELGRVLEKGRLETIFQIILPSAFPSIFTGLRLGISASWTNIVAAEMIAASSGMGHMISYAREMSQPASVLIGIFSIGIIGLLIDSFVIFIQKKVIYWNTSLE